LKINSPPPASTRQEKFIPTDAFASSVTMDGLRVSAVSIVEITEYLLTKENPFEYVLTGKFGTQDFIEKEFGNVRAVGGSNEKPTSISYMTHQRLLSLYRCLSQVMKRGRNIDLKVGKTFLKNRFFLISNNQLYHFRSNASLFSICTST